MVIWPVHCVTGAWGHNIFPAVADALRTWELDKQTVAARVLKGQSPLTEHFGVFEADVPLLDDESTQFNRDLFTRLMFNERILLAGEASSHCVAKSYLQMAREFKRLEGNCGRVVVLRDCMSPVPGFETMAEQFFEAARADGAQILTAAEAVAAL